MSVKKIKFIILVRECNFNTPFSIWFVRQADRLVSSLGQTLKSLPAVEAGGDFGIVLRSGARPGRFQSDALRRMVLWSSKVGDLRREREGQNSSFGDAAQKKPQQCGIDLLPTGRGKELGIDFDVFVPSPPSAPRRSCPRWNLAVLVGRMALRRSACRWKVKMGE